MKVFLTGMPGSGKSYWGKRIADKLGTNFYDLDALIEESHGAIEALIRISEQHFRDLEQATLLEFTETHSGKSYILATGGGTILRKVNVEICKSEGILVFLDTELEQIEKNLDGSELKKRPLIQSNTRYTLKGSLLKTYLARKAKYVQSHIITRLQSEKDLELFTIRLELFTKSQ